MNTARTKWHNPKRTHGSARNYSIKVRTNVMTPCTSSLSSPPHPHPHYHRCNHTYGVVIAMVTALKNLRFNRSCPTSSCSYRTATTDNKPCPPWLPCCSRWHHCFELVRLADPARATWRRRVVRVFGQGYGVYGFGLGSCLGLSRPVKDGGVQVSDSRRGSAKDAT